ncbi:MAG: cyclic nucleotide-binding domain-containing protein [Proteobacteria bacterium]|nr:cyclic nucleotide-binding domain-containing protein [Pseudomonadota bacterium]
MNTILPSRKVALSNGERERLDIASFTADEEVFTEGSAGDRAFIVQSGLVEIVRVDEAGERTIGYVGAGEIFGEISPIDRKPRTASARALRDTVCIVVPEQMLAQKIADADPFLRDLLYVLVAGMRDVTAKANRPTH